MLTQAELKKILNYNENTGTFSWKVKVSRNVNIGDVTGSMDGKGYLWIKIKGKSYSAHRLAWLFVHGYLPENDIDHRNRIRDDNSLSNLREVSKICNGQNCVIGSNNSSGFNGVSFNKQSKKWRASMRVNGMGIYLGSHDTVIDAALARVTGEDNCPMWKCNHRSENRLKLKSLGYKVC